MAKYQIYKGSPDIFETETGKKITEQQAQQAGLFTPQGLSADVEQIGTTRPDIKVETDFAKVAGTDLPVPEIPKSLSTSDFQASIQPYLAEQKKIREEYTDIATQVTNLRARAEQERLGAEKAIVGTEQAGMARGAETRFVRGEQALIGRQAQLEAQTRAAEEANLLARLGIAEKARTFISEDIETQRKIQDRLQADEDKVLARAEKLSTIQKNNLALIADAFKDEDFDKLSPQVKNEIARLSMQSGIDVDLAFRTAKAAANENAWKKYKDRVSFEQKEETPELREYKFAQSQGFKGTFLDYQRNITNLKESTGYKPPVSYQEWELAGKPGTYGDWLKEQNIKAPTIAQQTVAEYAARIEQSSPIVDSLENTIRNMNLVSFEAQLKLPPALQSKEMQQYMQAASNFINAKLRRESGAVISPTEFTEARSQYLPKPGDSDEVSKQKKDTRDLIYASLRNAAGTAYQSVDDLLGRTVELATLDSDIKNAIKDTARYQNREQLINDIVNHYGINQEEASKKVYSMWTDNTKR